MFPPKHRSIVCIAPHPDDETLGCGGTLLRHIQEGDLVHWVVITAISTEIGFSEQKVLERSREIERVAQSYGFKSVHQLDFPSMHLDSLPLFDIVGAISKVVRSVEAEVLYIPFRNDAHSDHAIVFDAAIACSKSFRYPKVKSVLAYETLSETEFGLKPEASSFKPNVFIDIEGFLERKIEIMGLYKDEMLEFPFPRSQVTLRALAQLRGSQSGTRAAEAFMLLKEIR